MAQWGREIANYLNPNTVGLYLKTLKIMNDNKEIWIKTGYETFAITGQSGLKIEPLAKKVGKNKSSFYHYFADLELYIDELLEYHIKQSCIIAEKEKKAGSINPDLIEIIVEHKIDILFNRQLRINRDHKKLCYTLEKSNEIIGNDFVMLWVRDLELNLNQKQLESIFELAIENFYLKINAENLNPQWLSDYFSHLKKIVKNFVQPN